MPGVAFSLRALRRPQLLRCPQAFGGHSRRWLHERKPLDYLIEKGLGDFMPPEALRTIAVDYQQGLLTRLNEEVKGTEEEAMTVADTVINSALDSSKILAFNYASQALNNHFFLENLKTPGFVDSNDQSSAAMRKPNNQDEISPNLIREIRGAHGSLAQLKSTFSAAAMGMFSSGWVWFVTDTLGNTAVVPTFGTGSLLVRAQSYIAHTEGQALKDIMFFGRDPLSHIEPEKLDQEESMSAEELDHQDHPYAFRRPGTTPASPTSGTPSSGHLSGGLNGVKPRFLHTSNVTRSEDFSAPTSPYDQIDPEENDIGLDPATRYAAHGPDANKLGQVLLPLFCVSVHEHAWMSAGYGVWGKEEYLKKFWNVVDWAKVSKSYDWYVNDAQRNKDKYT